MNGLQRLLMPLVMLCLFLVGFYTVLQKPPKDALIKLEVAPKGSSLKLNGKHAIEDENNVTAGTYTVTAERKGFASQARTVTVKSNESVYSGIVLNPTASNTKNWYKNNEDDRKLADGISSHIADNTSEQALRKNSLLQELPYSYGDGSGGQIELNPGLPLKGSGQPAIYIYAATAELRQEVLQWISSQGYSPSDMDLIFLNELDAYKPVVDS